MVKDDKLNFKHWLSRTILTGILLIMIVYAVEQYTKIELVVHALIAITIVLMLGFTHEGLHYYRAIKLGYKPKWFRTKFRVCFTISSHSNRTTWRKDLKKIGNFPYIFIVPISAFILVLGISLQHLGLGIAGIGSLLMHGVMYKMEGKEA